MDQTGRSTARSGKRSILAIDSSVGEKIAICSDRLIDGLVGEKIMIDGLINGLGLDERDRWPGSGDGLGGEAFANGSYWSSD
jgi:hypothetical protein